LRSAPRLLISAYSKGGQEVQSPQPEKSKAPVKMEQRGRILGIGGVFFKSANRNPMRESYSKHLGLADKGQGVMLPWREHDDPQKEHSTVWTIFPASSNYFDPSHAPFMINYIVDDLDALLDRLKQEGAKIDAKRMDESYGPTVALPGSMTWMGIRLSSGSRQRLQQSRDRAIPLVHSYGPPDTLREWRLWASRVRQESTRSSWR